MCEVIAGKNLLDVVIEFGLGDSGWWLRLSMFKYAKVVVDYVVEKGKCTTDELKSIVPERRLYDILSVLEALGVVKRSRKTVQWVGGGELVGREVIIEGLIDSVTHSPVRARVVGVEPLRVKVRG